MVVFIRRYRDSYTAQVIYCGVSFVGTSRMPGTRAGAIEDLQRQLAGSGVAYEPATFIESDHRATQQILDRAK